MSNKQNYRWAVTVGRLVIFALLFWSCTLICLLLSAPALVALIQ